MSLELNKIAASILTAGVVVMGSQFLADVLVRPDIPDEPVYAPEMQEASSSGQSGSDSGGDQQMAESGGSEADSGGSETAGGDSGTSGGGSGSGGDGSGKGGGATTMAAMLASADAEAGKSATNVCKACHSFNKGGPNKIGPNLYGVVGNEIASHEGFNYSDALKSKEGVWTFEKLSKYLKAPNEWAPGNKMSYQGIKDDQKRANVIEYMRQNDDSPKALPDEGSGSDDAASADDGANAAEKAEADTGSDQAEPAEKADASGGDEADGTEKADAGDGAAGEEKAQASDGDAADATQTAKAEGSAEADGGGSEIANMIANASAAKGEAASAVCKACHSFNEGGPHKIGPNLYNVLNRGLAKADGFSYTDALSSKGDQWTYEKLWNYLENPQQWAKGTNMSYAGLKDPKKRANMIAYLRQQGEEPPKLAN